MMQRNLIGLVYLLLFSTIYPQHIDKVGAIDAVKMTVREALGIGPNGISVDEVGYELTIYNEVQDKAYRFKMEKPILEEIDSYSFEGFSGRTYTVFGKKTISAMEGNIIIYENNKIQLSVGKSQRVGGGISFILKKPPHYVAFFVNQGGTPHAADTEGKIYGPKETMTLLMGLDYEKYRQSLERARELGLEEDFLANKVLVWGSTYYSTPDILNRFFKSQYGLTQFQYDQFGNLYQAFMYAGSSWIDIISPDADLIERITLTDSSKILSTYKQGQLFTGSTYVGFGGNIYFYVAGEDFTEVFRIRRTWGEPDFYAMAVNGYTDDSYGAYVEKVLKDLSKEDLRLLRNHLFALYGYVFKDAGLKAFFDKLVWYEADTGVSMDTIKLPAERQALLEQILAEEKKR